MAIDLVSTIFFLLMLVSAGLLLEHIAKPRRKEPTELFAPDLDGCRWRIIDKEFVSEEDTWAIR